MIDLSFYAGRVCRIDTSYFGRLQRQHLEEGQAAHPELPVFIFECGVDIPNQPERGRSLCQTGGGKLRCIRIAAAVESHSGADRAGPGKGERLCCVSGTARFDSPNRIGFTDKTFEQHDLLIGLHLVLLGGGFSALQSLRREIVCKADRQYAHGEDTAPLMGRPDHGLHSTPLCGAMLTKGTPRNVATARRKTPTTAPQAIAAGIRRYVARACRSNAMHNQVTNDQVSNGSHAQYRPQALCAQTAPATSMKL